ncbi:acylglycerol lipase [Aspergillus clavatus NRRL 1]|uniref:Alpha/beta hydrolase, putative n=1 Tax=Aspergillus clavatus (strain ATCC 1007 / CBS 513.65 / DSM 816 / NCTC 3887 / NRRL 1 / QM 1276 / 107) TaxID=344612 RepID=A1CLI1_ASPCL|nr:alpha/beta hydrolase, putative [Aspergillus clavatus NRRL 1]EAW10005.1 alpha/beta hydrolase, putative [Aspergillus clavatus NRRL 1]
MTDIQTTEAQFKLPDGVLVYQKTWTVSRIHIPSPSTHSELTIQPPAPVAKLLHFHGFSDHINNTYDLFPSLARRGILCTGIDQRGWGRSAQTKADRGHTGPTATILADMAAFIEAQLDTEPKLPVFVQGHSMGGGLVATLASTPKYQSLVSRLAGIMLEAPFIGLDPKQQPSVVTVFLGRLAGRILPRFQLVQPMSVETVVRDPAVQKALKEDPFNHTTGTLEMYANMLDRAAALSSGKLVLNTGVKSVYVAHGDGDQVTSYHATKSWFDRQTGKVADRKFQTYEGWSHLLHADLPDNRQEFADDLAEWILARA